MCGIYVAVSRHGFCPVNAHLKSLLQQRGPDSFLEHFLEVPIGNVPGSKVYISIASSVLALRGDVVVPQPILSSGAESFLCWNGEAWKFKEKEITGNDASAVFQLLTLGGSDSHNQVIKGVEAIVGPFAMSFFNSRNQNLYFGRDYLGRRSLLTAKSQAGDVIISSVPDLSVSDAWEEVEADGVYYIDLQMQVNGATNFAVGKIPYVTAGSTQITSLSDYIESPFPEMNTELPPPGELCLSQDSQAVRTLENLLLISLRLRICNVRPRERDPSPLSEPNIAILFSGGLDCTMLARLSHELLPLSESIDLLNVAFENPRIHTDPTVNPYELCPDRITARRSHQELQNACPGRAFRLLLINVPYAETLAHRPTITALMYPHDTEMDLSIATALYFAARGLGTLEASTSPRSSSAAQAPSTARAPHRTAARVLLSGLGADELFGGYHRHGAAFAQRGHAALVAELALDVGRLGRRNLGRDDRVLAHWAREPRYPFLDEDLVAWALRVPAGLKAGFGLGARPGVDGAPDPLAEPGKRVLRALALRCGMPGVAGERKRAIQFGARTAKMESGRVKGTGKIDGGAGPAGGSASEARHGDPGA